MSLHCNQCAFITTSASEAMTHVGANQTHVVSGPGKDPDTTLTIEVIEQ